MTGCANIFDSSSLFHAHLVDAESIIDERHIQHTLQVFYPFVKKER